MSYTRPIRGEIWFVDLVDPTMGHEQAKRRPCLIISSTKFNQGKSELVAAIPLTTKNRLNPLHVPIHPPEGGILCSSFILCDQLRIVSLKRLTGSCLGKAQPATLKLVEYITKTILDFE